MPYIAIFVSIPIFYLFEQLQKKAGITDHPVSKYIPYLLLIVLFIFPYKKIFSTFENTDEQIENKPYYKLSNYLQEAVKNNNTSLDSSLIIYDANTIAHIQFYINLLREKGIDISLSTYPDISTHNKVIVAQDEIGNLIETYYNYELTDKEGSIRKYRLLGRNDKDFPVKEAWEGFRIYEKEDTKDTDRKCYIP